MLSGKSFVLIQLNLLICLALSRFYFDPVRKCRNNNSCNSYDRTTFAYFNQCIIVYCYCHTCKGVCVFLFSLIVLALQKSLAIAIVGLLGIVCTLFMSMVNTVSSYAVIWCLNGN